MKEGIRSNIIAPGGISTEIGTAMGMNHIYVVNEQYANTYPDISKKAIEVVNLYNKYVKAYSTFVDELRKGYGDKSNRLAQMAEKEFNNLLNCILKYIE